MKIRGQLNENSDGQISTADANVKTVVFQRISAHVEYNVQAVSDAINKLLITTDTIDASGAKALSLMVVIFQKNIGMLGM